MRRAKIIQFMRRRDQIEFSVHFEANRRNVYNKILMYITLLTNEHTRLRLNCLFGFTIDNGGSQKTEILGNT